MRDVNVTRLDVNAIAALRSRIIETVNNTQKPGYPPNPEDIFDRVCGFVSGQVSGQVPIETDDEGLALNYQVLVPAWRKEQKTMSKTYAIADLHGRFDLLEMALARIMRRGGLRSTWRSCRYALLS
jgi:hypothetical protein